MALQHIPLDQINKAQLQNLIDGRAAETQIIEYKRDPYGDADKDRAEFLADISSFANTTGGDIVVGMAATKGVPTDFAPLQVDPDTEILRLESIARSGLQPRISNLAIRAVSIAGGCALLIRVPRRYNPPHRIVREGLRHNRFYARSSAGKYEPNIDELRLLFTRAPNLADRLRNFRFDRVAKIAANDGIVPLPDSHALILHVVPFAAFDTRLTLPLSRNFHWHHEFPPLGGHPSQYRINVDGLLTLSNAEPNARVTSRLRPGFPFGNCRRGGFLFSPGRGHAQKPIPAESLHDRSLHREIFPHLPAGLARTRLSAPLCRSCQPHRREGHSVLFRDGP